MEELEKILSEHGVKPTANRLLVQKALAEFDHPVTMAELEDKIDSIDKSGIFRTLMLFKEKHLLHQIDDGCEGVRYELCHAHGDIDDDRHVHFHCEVCHRTFCLEELPIPQVEYPEGFRVESVNYMAKGICPECARKGHTIHTHHHHQ
ncbi:MAG: transcriptional repressor [Bacteroidaceae bacterium]|nr:transcriptional repressor [Bacteroidaceae bacterium]